MKTQNSEDRRKEMGIAFFLGALSMLDVLFRDEIDDPRLHRRYVLELCRSSAPELPLEQVREYILEKVQSPSASWVKDFYLQRGLMS